MPRSEDIMGITLCNNDSAFIPNFDKINTITANKIAAIKIRNVFDCLILLLFELSILFNALVCALLSFFLKKGHSIHIIIKINIIKRTMRAI